LKHKGETHPTGKEVEQLAKLCQKATEDFHRRCREAGAFKPGELTPEEEEFVQREGLTALNYIPRKTRERQAAALEDYNERMRNRSEVMSRPSTDPERVRLESEERAERLSRGISARFDGFGYGMFLLLIGGVTYEIGASHGKTMAVFSCLLMLAVLELSYRLDSRR
jgi:hypothetical protein